MNSTYSLDASNEVIVMTMDYFKKITEVPIEQEYCELTDINQSKNINESFGNVSQCTTASADSADFTREYYSYYYQKQTNKEKAKNCCLEGTGMVCDFICDIFNCLCGMHCGIIFGCCD